MDFLRDWAALLGRALFAYVFIPAGYSKIGGFAATAGYMASKGLPAVNVLLALTIVIELLGGLALLVGWKARWAALALAGFTIIASVVFHNYWALPEAEQMTQQLMFVKNMGLVGGLLLVVGLGPGRLSVDRG
jgi:putative oxidoreductase